MMVLILLKVVTVATAYASGNAGGIFGPSLFIGAVTGGTVGSYRALGRAHADRHPRRLRAGRDGAAFAGIIRVPFTSVS